MVEKSVATINMLLLRITQTTQSNYIKPFQTSSNPLVYQDMYTFKNDFYRVQTNVVIVNLWIITLTSNDLIENNCDVSAEVLHRKLLCFPSYIELENRTIQTILSGTWLSVRENLSTSGRVNDIIQLVDSANNWKSKPKIGKSKVTARFQLHE